MAPRHFTVEEAETLLPHLTDLLSQIRELKLEHDRYQQRMAELGLKTRSNGHEVAPDLKEARDGIERTAAGVNMLMDQVHALGCEMKGIDEGLIDFRTLIEGRDVYLCWKLGEERIEWWHDLDTGFAGRQRLPERRLRQ